MALPALPDSQPRPPLATLPAPTLRSAAAAAVAGLAGDLGAPKDRKNIRILKYIISGIRLVLRLRTRM